MFGRRKRPAGTQPEAQPPAEVYLGLRRQILTLDPATVGITAVPGGRRTWGCLMETGHPNGTATLVCLADGTTSLYTSSGGGIIGGGMHESVVRETQELLQVVDDHLGQMWGSIDQELPASGHSVIRALTHDGPRTFEALEVDLGERRSSMSAVFYAAQEVITQLRLIDEARR
jgi:hypothetical protein